ncbi:MAG: hypothetical protein ACE5HB_08930, partial [Terriglobia bacterium]
MRAALNLASRPFVNYRRFVVTAGTLAVVALGLTSWVGAQSFQTWRERRATEARVRELQALRSDLMSKQAELEQELQDPVTQRLLTRTEFFNQLIEHKTLSWTELFYHLQEGLPPRVRVVSLSPQLHQGGRMEVQVRVSGDSARAVIDFLQALERGQRFREVVLESMNRERAGGRDAVVAELHAV